jgi:hypothetical protein
MRLHGALRKENLLLQCKVTELVKRNKLGGFSPQAKYTDRATATSRQSYCQLLWIEGVTWSAQRIPTTVNLGLLDPEQNWFINLI